MPGSSIFTALSSRKIATLIGKAVKRVIYAAPGIQPEPAKALVELYSQLLRPELTIALDFDEQTLRMGYGSLEAAKSLRDAGVEIKHSPGFRCGILIVDDDGWTFTPVAHYLEAEPQSDETPNAVVLSREQVRELAVRLSPESRREAVQQAATPEVADKIAELPIELGENSISINHFAKVSEAIKAAPPVKFDVVRQVRVFEPYLQYVEMHLSGAAIQKHRVQIPADLQALGASDDLKGRLRTTFDLLEEKSKLSSKSLEDELKQIRDDLTPSLGKNHGRAVLKAAKPHFETRIETFREKLADHQREVSKNLQADLDKSRDQVVAYYLPLAMAKPPDSVIGGSMIQPPPKEAFEKWLCRRLETVFPKAEKLIQKMVLEVQFKDVTFETLNRPDFITAVKKAFPAENWDKVYSEFKAAGEREKE